MSGVKENQLCFETDEAALHLWLRSRKSTSSSATQRTAAETSVSLRQNIIAEGSSWRLCTIDNKRSEVTNFEVSGQITSRPGNAFRAFVQIWFKNKYRNKFIVISHQTQHVFSKIR